MPELDMAQQLLTLAEEDARSLELMLQSGQFPLRAKGFQAQQAVEKALKAWLVLLDADYPLTHSVQALLSVLRDAGADCGRYAPLEGLSPYAVQLRYRAVSPGSQLDPANVTPLIADLLAHVRRLLMAAQEANTR